MVGNSGISQTIWWTTFLITLATGLTAGVFFAFSNFIMRGLALIRADQGIAAMQSVNITVVNPLFMAVLFGTAAACLPLLFWAIRSTHQPGAKWLIAGSVLYILGTIVVTAVFNVPLNNQLARILPGNNDAYLWASYLKVWTAWNHVRTLSSLLASAAFVVALCRLTSRA